MHILFIGAGRMAEAIFAGILHKNDRDVKVTVTNLHNKEKLASLKTRYHIETINHWSEGIDEADTILLACPPSAHDQLLEDLSPRINGQFVITVAAGVDPTFLEARLPNKTPVAWVMPNTAASVGKSMSTYTYGQHVNEAHKEQLQMILNSIGASEQLTEDQIHNLTAVTGSAPAFLYYFTEALQVAAAEYGLSQNQAEKLVQEMVIGSAEMLKTYKDPALLREQVTSPGGATDAGLKSLEKNHFQAAIMEAVKATNDHAKAKKN
ncbi:pyrroline-5-carboxylate reductase [Alkalihalophilus pseudofirmus]|uniref:pyrroline-5-carboxylate reductase n=1 Tax=Alkalihalophilus pseudofirmus TaxID=79885 RepID=UPI0009518D4F|nr:pyrroline-5-carboxylate reductase [Alkalihalophilus pseudofirmus]OLS34322.1 pyrroline-5-carboxylate reductase [Alkalihalophilus pseudofirmus]WEG17483.1 pyrroline-5-carboxylate reductase [Alkalihalophilus pseudofirmus]